MEQLGKTNGDGTSSDEDYEDSSEETECSRDMDEVRDDNSVKQPYEQVMVSERGPTILVALPAVNNEGKVRSMGGQIHESSTAVPMKEVNDVAQTAQAIQQDTSFDDGLEELTRIERSHDVSKSVSNDIGTLFNCCKLIAT